MAIDYHELGRKGGLANGRKKYAELDRVIGRVLKADIVPSGNVAAVLAQAGIEPDEKVNVYRGILTVIGVMAFNGNLNAAQLLFDLYGVTSNAREKLAKAAALEQASENPEGIKIRDIVPATPEELRAEAEALGVYGD